MMMIAHSLLGKDRLREERFPTFDTIIVLQRLFKELSHTHTHTRSTCVQRAMSLENIVFFTEAIYLVF